jgi:hypothetical protein
MISVYKYFIGKREGKRPLGRRRRRWEDIIKIYVKVAVTFSGQCCEPSVTMQFPRRAEFHGVGCLVTMGQERMKEGGADHNVRNCSRLEAGDYTALYRFIITVTTK